MNNERREAAIVAEQNRQIAAEHLTDIPTVDKTCHVLQFYASAYRVVAEIECPYAEFVQQGTDKNTVGFLHDAYASEVHLPEFQSDGIFRTLPFLCREKGFLRGGRTDADRQQETNV
ncbi:hypothetical protein [uncultured Alistipes sp.]|uniref:hypothetical protein n=1 Tax=uncultured Alistipes sp. TaxID=538949 RepID=UPI00263AC780|nr:hypothetical protein [uncultured Alistipes sp.]